MKSKKDLLRYEAPSTIDCIPPYQPTYRFEGEFIDKDHAFYATCPMKEHLIDVGIEGWLRQEDALKLYEMAYFAQGPILELGSYHGLSTSILSLANYNSGLTKEIFSVELGPSSHCRLARIGQPYPMILSAIPTSATSCEYRAHE